MSLPVAFLTDYGLTDEFVGVCHAVIARIAPDSRVIDISHGVERGNVRAGALALVRAIQYMPEGVALAVVDPTVGTQRRGIAAETPWGYLVGPDNGLLGPAVQMTGGASLIVSLEEAKYQLPRDGVTFDGRDIFAPAAALLAAGEVEIGDLGPEVETGSAVPLMLPLVDDSDGILRGEVLWVDGFGNAQTNITPEDMSAAGLELGTTVEVAVGASKYLVDWKSSYGDVEPGEGVVHIDSYGQIAVAVREGNASEDFNLAAGGSVVISSPQ